jgi:hypothetical protein
MLFFDSFSTYSINAFLQYGNVGFTQATQTADSFPQAGAYLQNGLLVFNSGFGRSNFITSGFDSVASGIVDWGMFCAPFDTGGTYNLHTMFSHLSINGVQSLSLACTTDRRLELWVGRVLGQFSGSLIYTSPPGFFAAQNGSNPVWTHLELRVDAAANRTQIYKNRVLFATVNAVNWINSPFYNGMVVHELENFGTAGVAAANYYATSLSTVGYGRVSAAMIAPWESADVLITGWTPTWSWPFLSTQDPPRVGGVLRARGGATAWGPSYPDISGFHSYVTGQGLALFSLDKCYPVGSIHALSIKVTGHKNTVSATRIRGAIRDINSSVTFFTPWKVMTDTYENYDLVFVNNPFTNSPWLEEQFVSVGVPYAFGFETDAAVEISAMYVVRLHTATTTGGTAYFSSHGKVGS